MISEVYYPEQRHLLSRTTIRRERLLPDNTDGEVLVSQGTRVSLHDIVARGPAPAPYVLIDAARFFNLKDPNTLTDLLEVQAGERVNMGETLAAKRGKKLISPVSGEVAEIVRGRIVLQELAPQIELEAGANGTVVGVRRGRGVIVEAYGAVLQGVWGSGRRAIGTIRTEPSDGMENIFGDLVDTQFRGAVVITRRPLKRTTFQVIEDQALSGVIAPSMEPDLIDLALLSNAAVMLTEGFGSMRMGTTVAQFLEMMDGRQATLDAVLPGALETRRPEVIVNVPLEPGERPPPPNLNSSLRMGREVRLARSGGTVGLIIGLPKEPVSLDNGLRVPCAQVELVTGEKIYVPLANIEGSGS
ncbi:MAG: hypothetical protein ABI835_03165 [Chloroflexota bacterium]